MRGRYCLPKCIVVVGAHIISIKLHQVDSVPACLLSLKGSSKTNTYGWVETDLPLLSIVVSQHEVQLFICSPLIEGNDVGQHVDVAQPLPEDAEQGVLRDGIDDVQGAGGTQVPLPANRNISVRETYLI